MEDKIVLTVNSICFFDSLLASGGGTIPPKISVTTGHMTMKFLPDVKLSEEAQNQKYFLT